MYRFLFLSLFIIASLFGIAKGVSIWFDSQPADTQTAAVATAGPPGKSMETNGEETTIRPDGSGRYYINAEANSRDTRFLIDTGADIVALTLEDAESLGVQFDRASFEEVTRTASGPGMGQHVKIERLTIADHEFRDVEALVVEGLETNLLGQSMIRQLGRIELREDIMVIHHSA